MGYLFNKMEDLDAKVEQTAGDNWLNKPVSAGPKPRPEIDELAKQGLTYQEIGNAVGLSGERIRQILERTGKNELRKELRQKLKLGEKLNKFDRKKVYEDISSLFAQRMYQLAEKEGWAYQKAVEYYLLMQKRSSNMPIEKLIKLFTIYEEHKNINKKLGLEELAERSGFAHAQHIGHVLKRVRLEPFYGSKERHPISEYKKEAIKRSYNLMSNSDIANFLNLPLYVLGRNLRRWNLKRERPSIDEKWRIVSQIYEAKDAGFKINEIVELLSDYRGSHGRPILDKDLDKDIVKVILKDKTIKQELIEKLRIMLNDNTTNKPYLTNIKRLIWHD